MTATEKCIDCDAEVTAATKWQIRGPANWPNTGEQVVQPLCAACYDRRWNSLNPLLRNAPPMDLEPDDHLF